MLQFSLGIMALFSANFLAYLIKTQSDISKVAVVILGITMLANLVATVVPTLISELWGIEPSKVTAHSFGLWFCLACGIAVGIGI